MQSRVNLLFFMSEYVTKPSPLFGQVGPRDEWYGVGRYRLAIQAGVTDCFFRLLFWNRAATAEVTHLPQVGMAAHIWYTVLWYDM